MQRHLLWLKTLVVAAAYAGSCLLGQLVAIEPGNVTAIFFASGVALAATLLEGRRILPAIWLGSFFGDTWSFWGDVDVMTWTAISVGVAVGASLQALAGRWLILKLCGRTNFLKRIIHVTAFVAIVGPVGCLISASFGTFSLWVSGLVEDNRIGFTWLTWWLGDTSGVLLITPLIVAFYVEPLRWLDLARLRTIWTSLAGAAVLGFLAFLAFGAGFFLHLREHFPFAFLGLPFAYWAAHRYGHRGGTLAAFALISLATMATIIGYGPFAALPLREGLLVMQLYEWCVVIVMVLMVGAAREERNDAFDLLSSTQERLNLALGATSTGVWDVAVKSGQVFLDKEALEFPSYGADETYHETCSRPFLVHPDDVPEVQKALDAHLRKRTELFRCVCRLRTADGTHRWNLVRGKVVGWDRDGNPVRMVGTNTDMTERMALAQRARSSEARFKTLVETAASVFLHLDQDGKIVEWNREAERVYGFSREAVLGKDYIQSFLPPETQTEVRRNISKVMGGEIARQFENPVLRNDGTQLVILWNVSPFVEEDGSISGIIAVGQDITQVKETQRRLLEAEDKAKSATAAKSRFLANMSHEIRTPLAAIIGFSELLLQQWQSEEVKAEFMKTINRNGKHLLALVSDVLDLSKIEAGELVFEARPMDLIGEIQSVIAMIQPQIQARSLKLEVEYVWPLPLEVTGDPTRFRQILMNVIGNAVKFTEEGGIFIWVEFDEQSENLSISIADTGPGIRDEDRNRLFLPFSQIDGTPGRGHGGTGLGLSISRQLAQEMGGDVHLEKSEPGRGSVFVVTIATGPVERSNLAFGPRNICVDATNIKQPTFEPRSRLQNISVLVVEDSFDNQILIEHLLTQEGARVELAKNGKEALSMARKKPFDVVLMDIQMPDMTGYQVTSELRREGFRTPIIALTANALKEDRRQCFEAGCNDYLTKPINTNLLVSTVAKMAVRRDEHIEPESVKIR